MSGRTVTIPDDRAFASFKAEGLCEEGWSMNHNKGGITVWTQALEEGKSIHKIKVIMSQQRIHVVLMLYSRCREMPLPKFPYDLNC